MFEPLHPGEIVKDALIAIPTTDKLYYRTYKNYSLYSVTNNASISIADLGCIGG